MDSILNKIKIQKEEELRLLKRNPPTLDSPPLIRDFITSLKAKTPAIIAEIKRASPSKGVIREDFEVASIAAIYERHGAACLSVLTDKHFFQGDDSYLALAKEHCKLPVLRKDFIIDKAQIYQSRSLGADCILLIVALLDDHELYDFCQLAQELQMAVLVESHTQEELERALQLPTPLMGINNRSLHTFQTDIQLSIDLSHHIPKDRIIIAESGIESHQEVQLLQKHHINTFLVGESLMRAEKIGEHLDKLIYG